MLEEIRQVRLVSILQQRCCTRTVCSAPFKKIRELLAELVHVSRTYGKARKDDGDSMTPLEMTINPHCLNLSAAEPIGLSSPIKHKRPSWFHMHTHTLSVGYSTIVADALFAT